MTDARRAWLLMVLVGCRGGASRPRHRPPSQPVPTSRPAPPPVPSFVPLDAGERVFRGEMHHFAVCMEECNRLYAQCSGATPECQEVDRLVAALTDPRLIDAGVSDAMASAVMSVLISERTVVCVQRCGEPDRLCGRRCYDTASDAGSSQGP
jgi:hypothetical protein